MASITQSSDPEIPDNHKESWLALLSAAEVYCQKSGCDLAILTACKKFRSSAVEGDGVRKWDSSSAFQRECDFSYNIWGQGFLAESTRRYVDDIGVLHSTTMLTAQRHTRQAGGEQGTKLVVDLTSDTAHRGVSGLPALHAALWYSRSVFTTQTSLLLLCLQSSMGDGGAGGVSPNNRLYSQSYPSIYSAGDVIGPAGGHNGNGETEREKNGAERDRQRPGIVDVEEECEEEEEEEDEDEEEDMDGTRRYGNESAGEEFTSKPSLQTLLTLHIKRRPNRLKFVPTRQSVNYDHIGLNLLLNLSSFCPA